MSFAVPRNLPSSKSGDDSAWRPSSNTNNLPYYKDKPYGVDYKSTTKKRRRVLILSALALAFLYLVYQVGRNNLSAQKTQSSGPKSWPERQQAVKDTFVRSWDGYKKYAWGNDVYHPISKTGENMGPKPLGWMIVDSLDTMAIMGLDKQLKDAKKWVSSELDYDMDYEVNTFETSIRMLGGLLSAYYLTEDKVYLNKAVDLGDRLLGAFDSGSGVPYASVNLKTGTGKKSHTDGGASSTAEAATVQLEFKYLAQLTGRQEFWDKAEKVYEVIANRNNLKGGLVPIFIQPESGRFQGNLIRMGSRGDSYYEYLIKQYVQTNFQESVYREMYDEAVQGIKDHLVEKSYPSKLTYIAELDFGFDAPTSPKMDHLVCFAGGMLALGATNGDLVDDARRKHWTTTQENDMQLARELTRTCYEIYAKTASGLAPEIVFFNKDTNNDKDFTIKLMDAHNLQRPETVESLFVLYRLTKNEIYREWGWKIFESFEKWTRLEGDAGYTSVQNVKEIPPELKDNMESFWFAETLKYLYLLFDDREDYLPLNKIVFNTEGHPFPVFSLEDKFKTGWQRTASS